MITLNIEAINAEQLREEIARLFAGMHGAVPMTIALPIEEKPATRSRKKAEPEVTADPTPAPTEQTSAGDAVGGSTEASSAASQSSAGDEAAKQPVEHEIEITAIKQRAMTYTQAAGPQPLVEMLKGAGAATGKFSEIADDTGALKKVSDALAAAGY